MKKDMVMKQALALMSGNLKEEIKNNLENTKAYTRLFVKIIHEIDSMKVKIPKFITLKNDILNINKAYGGKGAGAYGQEGAGMLNWNKVLNPQHQEHFKNIGYK